ncbi:unnamed protein product [Penicillium salamii]|nr:unnamed protein product [Penicillium salamii]
MDISTTEHIDLSSGWPNPALLPANLLRTSATEALSNPSVKDTALHYGADEGYDSLRTHIAEWLSTFYQPCAPVTAPRVCITGGASQNLACVLQVFTDPIYTRNVWMVAPTYFLAARILDDAGFAGRLRGIPEDDEGIDLEFLENGLQAAEATAQQDGNTHPVGHDPRVDVTVKLKPARPWRKIYKHVIYAVPTFANPSGKIMSLRRREGLVRIARRYDALILTDDVYDFLQWSPTPGGPFPDRACVPRIVDVDRYLDGGPVDEWGHAISNGSFSKLIGPGVRTGWAEASDKLAYGLSQTGSSRSGGAPSHLTAAIIDQLFPTGITAHLQNQLIPSYASQYHTLVSAIHEYLVPLGVTAYPPGAVSGGYFIWLKLPEGLHASQVAEQAQEAKVRVASGVAFQVPDDPSDTPAVFGDHMRLCFAWESSRHLTEGVRRLARVLERMKNGTVTRTQ